MTKAIMIQGAGSNVGKSMVVAGLCRLFTQRGLTVRPFKPQNMSNNAAVTSDGGEIGRAQALQALACGVAPHTDMNPVLLKPESDVGAQVIVQGKRYATLKARDYAREKPTLLRHCVDSYKRLAESCDLIVIEGAGSPAEINLRAGDIANMGFAEAVEADGLVEISKRTGWTSIGVLPWFADAWKLPAEDVMDVASRAKTSGLKIAVPRLNRIANFDDLDPLAMEPGVSVEIIETGRPLPGDADLVLIPGSKSTIADLAHFRAQGWDTDLFGHVRRGGHVLGICGGYQMLGRIISDPQGIEGAPGSVAGLGLLDVTTVMAPHKHLSQIRGTHLRSGAEVTGYEIHIGETGGPDTARGWLDIDGRPAGAASADGRVQGCYLHGLFGADAFRAAYLEQIGGAAQVSDYAGSVERTLDGLAAHLDACLDVDALLALATDVPQGG